MGAMITGGYQNVAGYQSAGGGTATYASYGSELFVEHVGDEMARQVHGDRHGTRLRRRTDQVEEAHRAVLTRVRETPCRHCWRHNCSLPGKHQFSGALSSLHKALLLLSFGGFGLSAVGAVMYLTQENDLKLHKFRAILSKLPSLERLEKAMTVILWVSFALLTAGLFASSFDFAPREVMIVVP